MGKNELSVVVPTYEEAMNIKPLCTRLFKANEAQGITTELYIVDDDSGQGTIDTQKVVDELKKDYDVKLHIRRKGEGSGLSSAVVLGLQNAKYDTMMCMDADLQHEPEAVWRVAEPIFAGTGDFSVGSRNTDGGKVEDWPLHRKLISGGATALALPLASCSDPMSGFFCLSRDTFKKGENLNPMGYKIGLELMVRCGCTKVVEVPITFRDREAGESKLTMKQNLLYIQHLGHLYMFKYPGSLIGLFLCAVLVISLVAAYLANLL